MPAIVTTALLIGFAVATSNFGDPGKEETMKATITCGKHMAEHANISGSRFHDVNMAGVEFDDVNMGEARFHNINMSDISVSAVQMGGARFKHIGLPPGSQEKQRPLSFEEADLNGSTFTKCDLAGVQIKDCNVDGMMIEGIPVADLLAAYKQRGK